MTTVVDLGHSYVAVRDPDGVAVCTRCKGFGTVFAHLCGSFYGDGFAAFEQRACPVCRGRAITYPAREAAPAS